MPQTNTIISLDKFLEEYWKSIQLRNVWDSYKIPVRLHPKDPESEPIDVDAFVLLDVNVVNLYVAIHDNVMKFVSNNLIRLNKPGMSAIYDDGVLHIIQDDIDDRDMLVIKSKEKKHDVRRHHESED